MMLILLLIVTNPADQRVIGHVPDMSEADVNEAVKSAYTAFESWKKTTAKVVLFVGLFLACISIIVANQSYVAC